jgi:hypothetical protein
MGNSFSLDPSKSSMVTGAGLPWGAMESGNPGSMPTIPSDRKTADYLQSYKPEFTEAKRQFLATAAQEQNAAGAQAAKMGAGQSAGAARNAENISAKSQANINAAQTQLQEDYYKQAVAEKQYAEQMDLQKYNAALASWQYNQQRYDAEKAARAKVYQPAKLIKTY